MEVPAAQKRKIMVWDCTKDELLLREVLLIEPCKFKHRSRERGGAWKLVADHLNSGSTSEIYFKVDARAVRERVDLLIAHYLSKQKEEEHATGINPEPTLLDETIQNVLDRIEVCEAELNQNEKENDNKCMQDKEKAVEMRKKAMETFQETKARKKCEDDEENPPNKKRRSSGSDTIQYLREKADADNNLKQQELEIQRNEQRMRHEQFQGMMLQMHQQQQQMMSILVLMLEKK